MSASQIVSFLKVNTHVLVVNNGNSLEAELGLWRQGECTAPFIKYNCALVTALVVLEDRGGYNDLKDEMMSQVNIPGPYAAIRFTLGRTFSCKILLQFKHYGSS